MAMDFETVKYLRLLFAVVFAFVGIAAGMKYYGPPGRVSRCRHRLYRRVEHRRFLQGAGSQITDESRRITTRKICSMNREEFESAVAEALDNLPIEFAELMSNITIQVREDTG